MPVPAYSSGVFPEPILEGLLSFGRTAHDHRGSQVLYFDHEARNQVRKIWSSDTYMRLEPKLEACAVLAADGSVITVPCYLSVWPQSLQCSWPYEQSRQVKNVPYDRSYRPTEAFPYRTRRRFVMTSIPVLERHCH
jgi:hypothetical protein